MIGRVKRKDIKESQGQDMRSRWQIIIVRSIKTPQFMEIMLVVIALKKSFPFESVIWLRRSWNIICLYNSHLQKWLIDKKGRSFRWFLKSYRNASSIRISIDFF